MAQPSLVHHHLLKSMTNQSFLYGAIGTSINGVIMRIVISPVFDGFDEMGALRTQYVAIIYIEQWVIISMRLGNWTPLDGPSGIELVLFELP